LAFRPPRRDYLPVAPTWERNPDDQDIWRRITTMPSLALNRAELDFFGTVAGKTVCVLGVGDGMAPLALAALGAKVTVVDPTRSALDMLMVRTQLVGIELQYREAEFTDLAPLGEGCCELSYAAQMAGIIADLGRFYSDIFRLLGAGGRLIVNEYHPFRRIWKLEPGAPRVAFSYFERRRPRTGDDATDITISGQAFGRYNYHWTVSDHFNLLIQAGFQVVGLEEVGDSRERWELPNLGGLPEQLIIAADKPR